MSTELTKTPVEEGALENQETVESVLFQAIADRHHIKPLALLNRDKKTFARLGPDTYVAFYVSDKNPPFAGVPESFYRVSGSGDTREKALSDLLTNSLRITDLTPLKIMYRSASDAE